MSGDASVSGDASATVKFACSRKFHAKAWEGPQSLLLQLLRVVAQSCSLLPEVGALCDPTRKAEA